MNGTKTSASKKLFAIIAIFISSLAISSCDTSQSYVAKDTPVPAQPNAVDGNPQTKQTSPQQPKVGTVKSLVNGDLMCYVTLVDENNIERQVGADFEICANEKAFLNQKVRLTYELASINDCQSIEPCGKSRMESIITKMEIIGQENSQNTSKSQTLSNSEWIITNANEINSVSFTPESFTTTAVRKVPMLAFTALQKQGNTVKNSLFTIHAKGSPRRGLTPKLDDVNPTLVWSENGRRLAFVSGDTDVYTVNADGSKLTKLLSEDFCKASSFNIVWLPNNERIAFTRHCDGFTSDTPGSESLYVSDTTGIKGTKLIQNWQAGGIPPKTKISSLLYLSPDGKQVAFVKDKNIYKINTDGSGLTNLTNKPGDYVSGGSGLVWSPDGTRIAFYSGEYPNQQIYVINANGGKITNLTNNPANQVYNVNLFWSPDGKQIAYYHNQPGDSSGEHQDIYLLNINGGKPRNLTQKLGQYDGISWSPDGKQVAFVSGDFSNQKLYKINVDGSNQTELTPRLPLSGVGELAWSPDSQQIAFTSALPENSSLYVVNRNGSRLTKLTNAKDLGAYAPTWQP